MDYEIVDETDVILFVPIDQQLQANEQTSYEEFWSDECWKTPE